MPSEHSKRAAEAAADTERFESLRAAFRAVIAKMDENAGRFPDLAERRERLRSVREACVGNRGLLARAVANLEANRVRVCEASDAEAAIHIVLEELGGEKLLVKSKTNLAKEIGLTSALRAAGVEVVETDIGDRILQLAGEPTAHPTCPCAQLDRYDIARVLSEHLGRDVEPDPNALIDEIRAELVPLIERARVGLTGANAIAAAEGAVLMIHNEGNLDLVSQRPGKLIILASPEKLYPDLEEAVNMARLETYYATGQPVTSFMRVISGPSKTADIEKELYYGVHGPGEVVLILIDNGRSELMSDERLREALFCIGCGACLLQCPVYDILGPEYGTPGHLGGIGVCADCSLGGTDVGASVDAGLPFCTTCALCAERCPVSIDVPGLVEELRARGTSAGFLPMEEHQPLVASIRNYANPWMQPRQARSRWANGLDLEPHSDGGALFFAGCSLAFVEPEAARAAVRVLRSAGLEPAYLGSEERCCGSPLLRLGEVELYERLARENIELFKASGAREVIALCPGCLKALRDYRDRFPEFDLKVRHISEVVAEAVEEGALLLKAPSPMKAAYHDPCHLGRGCGIYEEPRRVLSSILGLELVEMDRNRELSACCGSGGGVKSAFPELAWEIGRKRAGMAREAGAGVVITCCPWCEQNLAEHIETHDLMEIISDSLVDRCD